MSMTGDDVRQLVMSQLGGAGIEPVYYGIDLRRSLVPPVPIKVINRRVRNGELEDQVIDAWLVLVENSEQNGGYRIVYSESHDSFGLAVSGFKDDAYLVLIGLYGDFVTTLEGM